MSLIRKPAAAEQESSLRRAAETTIAKGRAMRDVGKELGSGTRRVVSKLAQMWLLVGFTFGELMVSSVGAKIIGLTIMAPFWYLVLRRRDTPIRGSSSSTNDFHGYAKLARPDGTRKGGAGQLHAVGVASVAMVCAGPSGRGTASTPSPDVVDSGFDPDAAIARYLVKRDAELSQPLASYDVATPQYQRPQFGTRRA